MAFLFVDISLPYSNSRVMRAIIKALEVVFISVGVVFTLLVLKVAAAPYACEAVFSGLVAFRDATDFFLSTPLYVCLAINFMVVLIAVSSTFHRQENDLNIEINPVDDAGILGSPPQNIAATATPLPPLPQNITITKRKCTKLENSVEKETTTCDGGLGSDSVGSMMEENRIAEIHVEVESLDTENEEEDSIEATWNAIIGGGTRKPKKKQLPNTTAMRRLDSEEILPTTPKWKELRKSETFNDAVSVTRRGGLIRKDPSMTPEELNQQVEAFIKKFNHEMRLQRQESDQRFLDMINNRGL